MVKVTFQTQRGIYWAVCESVRYDELEGYDLDGVLENSRGPGPACLISVSPKWQIVQVEEA